MPEAPESTLEQAPQYTEWELEEARAKARQLANEILDASWIQSQEKLRMEERYGKAPRLIGLKEWMGGERARVKGERIEKGRQRRWLGPTAKMVLGGVGIGVGVGVAPAAGVALLGLGASQLARGTVEFAKLWREKKLGVREAIEDAYVAKYNQAIELAGKLSDISLEEETTGKSAEEYSDAYKQAVFELVDFVREADQREISNFQGNAKLAGKSTVELEADFNKFERRWKTAGEIIGLVAGGATALTYGVLQAKAETAKTIAEKVWNFDQDRVSHLVRKSKEGWIYLYNNVNEADLAKELGAKILSYGDRSAHLLGHTPQSEYFQYIALVKEQVVSKFLPWIAGTVGALAIQSGYGRLGAAVLSDEAEERAEQRREKIKKTTQAIEPMMSREIPETESFKPGEIIAFDSGEYGGLRAEVEEIKDRKVKITILDDKENSPNSIFEPGSSDATFEIDRGELAQEAVRGGYTSSETRELQGDLLQKKLAKTQEAQERGWAIEFQPGQRPLFLTGERYGVSNINQERNEITIQNLDKDLDVRIFKLSYFLKNLLSDYDEKVAEETAETTSDLT